MLHTKYKIPITGQKSIRKKRIKTSIFPFLVRRAVSIPQIRYAAAAAVFKSSTAHSNKLVVDIVAPFCRMANPNL